MDPGCHTHKHGITTICTLRRYNMRAKGAANPLDSSYSLVCSLSECTTPLHGCISESGSRRIGRCTRMPRPRRPSLKAKQQQAIFLYVSRVPDAWMRSWARLVGPFGFPFFARLVSQRFFVLLCIVRSTVRAYGKENKQLPAVPNRRQHPSFAQRSNHLRVVMIATGLPPRLGCLPSKVLVPTAPVLSGESTPQCPPP